MNYMKTSILWADDEIELLKPHILFLEEKGCEVMGVQSVRDALEVLEDNAIPHLKKDRGTGNVVRIITGFSMYGVDVFVRPEDSERAAALMDELFSGAEGEDAEEENA